MTSIGSEAFSACISLTSIEIPEGVTSIENGTFYRCEGLTSITIPDSVKWIWAEAFLNCRSLTSVYYKGTPDKWSKILIHNSNSGFTDATRYYFSEEAPDEAKWQESKNWWHYDADGEIVIWKKSDAVS